MFYLPLIKRLSRIALIALFSLLGAILIIFFWLPEFRIFLANQIMKKSVVIAIGLLFLMLSGLVAYGEAFLRKKNALHIRMKPHRVSVEEAIIRDYVNQYWTNLFPNTKVLRDILIRPGQEIEIFVSLPSLSDGEKQVLFQRVQNELGILLSRRIGYDREFQLFITENS